MHRDGKYRTQDFPISFHPFLPAPGMDDRVHRAVFFDWMMIDWFPIGIFFFFLFRSETFLARKFFLLHRKPCFSFDD